MDFFKGVTEINLTWWDNPTGSAANSVIIIINIILGLLAVIALILLIYSGFSFMFSGGNSEKTKKAKDVIVTTIIGLVLILSAFAISNYAFSVLNKATGGESSDSERRGTGGVSQECLNAGGRACVALGSSVEYNVKDCDSARNKLFCTANGQYCDESWQELEDDCPKNPITGQKTCACTMGVCCGPGK